MFISHSDSGPMQDPSPTYSTSVAGTAHGILNIGLSSDDEEVESLSKALPNCKISAQTLG